MGDRRREQRQRIRPIRPIAQPQATATPMIMPALPSFDLVSCSRAGPEAEGVREGDVDGVYPLEGDLDVVDDRVGDREGAVTHDLVKSTVGVEVPM